MVREQLARVYGRIQCLRAVAAPPAGHPIVYQDFEKILRHPIVTPVITS